MLMKKQTAYSLQVTLESKFEQLRSPLSPFKQGALQGKIIICYFQSLGYMHLDANENNFQFWSFAK